MFKMTKCSFDRKECSFVHFKIKAQSLELYIEYREHPNDVEFPLFSSHLFLPLKITFEKILNKVFLRKNVIQI